MNKKKLIITLAITLLVISLIVLVSADFSCIDHSLVVGKAQMGYGIIEEKAINKMVCFRW